MLSLKKRLVMGVILILMVVATALPVGAQDNGTSTPVPNNPTTITIQIGGIVVTLSLPVRCGNNC
jgi:hypothetical protein